MFPEFQDQIARLASHNPHFASMVQKHCDLDLRIQNIETGRATGSPLDIEKLKKEKLHIKDKIYALLRDNVH